MTYQIVLWRRLLKSQQRRHRNNVQRRLLSVNFKYYQENIIKKIKKDCKIKLVKDIKVFLKSKKSNDMVVNLTKISQKMKN